MRNKRRLTRIEPTREQRVTQFPMSRRLITDEQVKRALPQLAVASIGALVSISFLMPADGRSVYSGEALVQNLGWLLAALLTLLAAKYNDWSVLSWKTWPVASCLGWLVVSCVVANQEGNGRAAWNGFWQVISLGLCYWIVFVLSRYSEIRRVLMVLILTCCVAEAAIGLHQIAIGFRRVQLQYVSDPDGMLRQQGIDAPAGSIQRKRFESRLLYGNELSGSFALANSLATTLGAAVILGCGCWATKLRTRKQQKISLTLAPISVSTIGIFMIVICFMLTKSRSGLIAVVVSGLVYLCLERPWKEHALLRRWMLPAGCTLAAIGSGLAMWLIASGRIVLAEAWKSFAFRVDYWQATVRMIIEHFWFGVGLGNFQSYYPRYKLDRASEIIADPHNWMLDVVATMSGPLGIVIVFWVIAGLFARQVISAQESSRHGDQGGANHNLERAVIKGAALGSSVCLGLMALTGQALEIDAVLPACVAAAGFMWANVGSRSTWQPSTNMLRCAVLSIVIALLASGSWQASGIGVPLICLMAIFQAQLRGAEFHEPSPLAGTPTKKDLPKGRVLSLVQCRPWLPTIVVLCCLAVFLVQTWRPVSLSWTLFQQSGRARDASERLDYLERSAQADRLDSAPLVGICQLLGQEISVAESPAQLAALSGRLTQAIDKLLENDSISHLNWQLAGDTALTLAGSHKRLNGAIEENEHLKQAQHFYAQAEKRYPGSMQLIIQNAMIAAALGSWEVAHQQVNRGLALEQLIEHEDQRIANQLIWLPYLPEGFSAGAVVRSSDGSPWAQAEPLLNWIRTNSATSRDNR